MLCLNKIDCWVFFLGEFLLLSLFNNIDMSLISGLISIVMVKI